ncbi:unnamed protein product [Cyprideis torosa]|uniref:Uncharacterized protein n=1 Tax=Cyprideis torosa TaxID=163714 RepID=A0A7R8ZKQ6_9CRUS|nr:unnamed protein product [Cyprideis torosa]CAG0891636.1 unnamed protein product [Cyprideis torosa]
MASGEEYVSAADSGGIGQNLTRKMKEHPYVPFGILGALGAVAFSVFKARTRGHHPALPTSLYIIHTRLAAQGFVVVGMLGGVISMLYKNHYKPYMAGTWHEVDENDHKRY